MDTAQSTIFSLTIILVLFGGGAAFCVLVVLSGGYRVVLRDAFHRRFREYREGLTAVRRKLHEQRNEEILELRGHVHEYREAREEERRRVLRSLDIDFDEDERNDDVAELESRVGDCNRLVQGET